MLLGIEQCDAVPFVDKHLLVISGTGSHSVTSYCLGVSLALLRPASYPSFPHLLPLSCFLAREQTLPKRHAHPFRS